MHLERFQLLRVLWHKVVVAKRSKCLLVDSHWQREEIGPRLALGCLSAAVRDLVEVRGVEFLVNRESLDAIAHSPAFFWVLEQAFLRDIGDRVRADPQIGIVAVTGWSGSFPRMLRIAQVCKSANPDVVVVFGGPHITLHERYCLPRDSILREHDCVDYLVVGEGELAFRRLVQQLSVRSRLDIGRRGILHNVPACPSCAENGDSTAVCAHTAMTYWPPFLEGSPRRIVFLVETARGCPRRCSFCDESDMWKRYRRFDVGQVLPEIEKGIEEFGSLSFRFADSSLTANPDLDLLCRELVRRDVDASWSAFAHCSEVTERKAAMMAEAGCKCVLIGVESGVQSVLDSMRKGTSVQQIGTAVQMLRREGIHIRGSFIVGYPGETAEQAMLTVDFAKSLNLDAYAWHLYQPPFRLLQEREESRRPDFAHYELDSPPDVTVQVLMREPSLLRDMHALPRLAALDPALMPDPHRWPTRSARWVEILRKAIAETGDGGAHDLDLLLECERARRHFQEQVAAQSLRFRRCPVMAGNADEMV